MLHLPRLLPDEIVPAFVDLQGAVQVSGLGGLYYNWARAAYKAVYEQRKVTLTRPKLADFSLEPAIALRGVQSQKVASSQNRSFLLLAFSCNSEFGTRGSGFDNRKAHPNPEFRTPNPDLLRLIWVKVTFFAKSYFTECTPLREWLDTAEQALGERKLFFTFDEFEKLVA